jgi:hypothetical protein
LNWLIFELLLAGNLAARTRELPAPGHDDEQAPAAGPGQAAEQPSSRDSHAGEQQWDTDRRALAAAGDQAGSRALHLAAKQAGAEPAVVDRSIADGTRPPRGPPRPPSRSRPTTPVRAAAGPARYTPPSAPTHPSPAQASDTPDTSEPAPDAAGDAGGQDQEEQ